jgi:hypothetical protein
VSGACTILLALSWGGKQYPWASTQIIGLLIIGLILAVAFVFVQSRASEPILPLRLFRQPTFSIGNGAGFILGFCMFGSIIYVPLYLQIVKGATPTASGLLLLPMMGGIIGSSIISGRAISRIGHYKWFPVAGTLVMATGLLLFIRLAVDTSLWQAAGTMMLIGVGLGLSMQPLILAVQNSLDRSDMGAGTSAATFFRSLGGSLGVAALGAIMTNRLSLELAHAIAKLPEGVRAGLPKLGAGFSINEPARIRALPAPIRSAIQEGFVNALHPVFLVAAAMALLAAALTLALPDHKLAGAEPGAGPGADLAAGADVDFGSDTDSKPGASDDREQAGEPRVRT